MIQRADAAAENLLERFQILFARQVISNAVAKPLAPIASVARRTSTPTQVYYTLATLLRQ